MMPIKLSRELKRKFKKFANKFVEIELADKSAKVRKAAVKEITVKLERLTVDYLEGLPKKGHRPRLKSGLVEA